MAVLFAHTFTQLLVHISIVIAHSVHPVFMILLLLFAQFLVHAVLFVVVHRVPH